MSLEPVHTSSLQPATLQQLTSSGTSEQRHPNAISTLCVAVSSQTETSCWEHITSRIVAPIEYQVCHNVVHRRGTRSDPTDARSEDDRDDGGADEMTEMTQARMTRAGAREEGDYSGQGVNAERSSLTTGDLEIASREDLAESASAASSRS